MVKRLIDSGVDVKALDDGYAYRLHTQSVSQQQRVEQIHWAKQAINRSFSNVVWQTMMNLMWKASDVTPCFGAWRCLGVNAAVWHNHPREDSTREFDHDALSKTNFGSSEVSATQISTT